MSPQNFIFIGRSGCGKGTQAALLQKLIMERNPQSEIFYLETGANFRQFIQGNMYSNELAQDVYKTGNRQPDFLAIWMWANALIEGFKGTEYAIFDGVTRSLPEAMAFTTAMEFYNRNVYVIYLNVSRAWSEARLLARGRSDDVHIEEIRKRLDWFDKDSLPAIEYFNIHGRYTLLDINGEQEIDKVHADIVGKLGW